MGFVKLPNSLSEWAWINDNNTLAVYIRLFLEAAWKDRQYKNISLKRGQVATTTSKIAEQSDLTIQQVRTVLDRLKATNKITVERVSQNSIITLIDYDCDFENNKPNNTPTTDEQQTNNTPATDQQQISNKPTTDQQQISNKPTTDEQQTPYINRNTEYKNIRKSEDKNKNKDKALPAPPQKDKKHYAEYVTMTETEFGELVGKIGTEGAKWCIEKLDNYKGAKGKTYKSDYRAILSWVIESYQEEQAKHKQTSAKPPGNDEQPKKELSWEEEQAEVIKAFYG